ncbi:glycoside hydrolase family 78 protein [Auricularia subglabra TFB-10046 SS5]|nr:glycoside hydrolase family 78 protein [Auricularia subglabra TFB-10046 SS5]
MRHLLSICALLPFALGSAPAGPWDSFNYAPTSKTVWPRAVFESHGHVTNAARLPNNKGSATLSGKGTWVALDFGVEVGGLISMNIDRTAPSSSFALSFSESPIFVRADASDDSSNSAPNTTYDGVLRIPAPLTAGHWTQPAFSLRGGFRYLTIVLTSKEAVTISNISCAISFMPHFDDLRDYSGHFFALDPHSKDKNFLTKLWYAGAYTVQTNTIPLHTGRQVPFVRSPGWANNATLGVAGPIIVDGAKRDRAVWPGDMGIAVPTQFVSTNDLIATKNALATMFAAMNPVTGALPESGPPLSQLDSDTYHMWTLVGTRNYFLYSGDSEWLSTVWSNYTKAIQFVTRKVDSSGLMNVTGLRDWARLGGGGHNAEGNAILYKVLTDAADLATHTNQPELATSYAANASALKAVFNSVFWDDAQGMYRDNASTTLCPQDANSFAVLFNLTTSLAKAQRVSAGLTRNWNELGPVAPELPDTISPFISGFELQAHFEAGNDETAMELLRREWGYMLYTNISVQSTLLEGFTANGSLSYRSYRGYNYDPAYTSHAHGWSSGPTSALTFYVLGMSPTAPQGAEWRFDPHTSGLSAAEGSFETPLGRFSVQWTLGANGAFDAALRTPPGTRGTISLAHVARGHSRNARVLLDGRNAAPGVSSTFGLGGGTYTVQIRTD